MQYWNTVVNEVQHKNNKSYDFLYTDQGRLCTSEDPTITDSQPIKTKIKRDLRTYYLGDDYPDVYFTKREAECAFWMVHGLTIAETAYKMYLSHRTVEFYVKNMKSKMGCASKKRMLEKVSETNLIQQLKNEGMRIVVH